MGARATKHFLSDRSASSGGAGAGGSGNDSSETVAKFTYAEGRRFHGTEDVPYFLPNDDEEADRLHAQHFMLRAVVGGNYITPLNNPRRVIDVGTGPGTWIMDMAVEFPECDVLGVDITPMSESTVMPKNCRFGIMDVSKGLAFEDNAFDMVHDRFMSPAIKADYWAAHVVEMARVCKPGGVLELWETDAMLRNPGPNATVINDWFRRISSLGGIHMEKIWDLPEMLRAAGLVVESEERYEVPMGESMGPLGKIGWHDVSTVIRGVQPKLVAAFKLTEEEINERIVALKPEVNERRCYWQMKVFVARKPLAA
ncbi:S-adenosyl-L-methionine-dependent methyltransferase [Thamnocephalis sphaerospora]|uniref:S-adenosyl-L-methionine-dependent methyltransferase n=1 Tax=Thamnocephalis sphaerospora TaxID=78915 RepID=A0A4P9XSP2_9FUNG|nr:S-adenosyl-L-methionine-dependent methyltransferase [Thamnocephalis sphaerospora]|eukprot:RKP09146.1 S-adenosyl-L-methionine-dependent methyltransferase [Thamnocephalis sphaerospora]